MASEMNPEKIQEQYQIYKAQQAAKKAEEEAEKLAKEQRHAELEARLAKIRETLKPHAVTIAKAHKCAGCKATIAKGARVIVEGQMTRIPISYASGSTIASFKSLYYCNHCKPLPEA